MVVRNFITVLGIVGVFGLFFLVVRPDWIKQIASSPSNPNAGVTSKINARLSADRLRQTDLPREKGGFLQVDEATVVDASQKIVEDVGEDVPSRNSPYLLIVNKSNNVMRHCRLSSAVRKVALKLQYPEVRVQEIGNTQGGPYQVIIWVPHAMDLQLEIDVLAATSSRS